MQNDIEAIQARLKELRAALLAAIRSEADPLWDAVDAVDHLDEVVAAQAAPDVGAWYTQRRAKRAAGLARLAELVTVPGGDTANGHALTNPPEPSADTWKGIVLAYVRQHANNAGGRISIAELSAGVHGSKSHMYSITKALADDGWIERISDEHGTYAQLVTSKAGA